MSDTEPQGGLLPEFSVGGVLSKTFSTFFANFFKFFILSSLLYLPIIGATFVLTGSFVLEALGGQPQVGAGFVSIFLALTLLSVVVLAIAQAGTTFGAIEYMSRKPATLGAMLGMGMRRVVPLVIAGILAYIVMVLGFVLLIVPGLIVAMMLSVVVPVIVAENKGPFEALRRSRELTSGYKWPIFGAFLVLGVIMIVVQFVLTFLFTGSIAAVGTSPEALSAAGIALGVVSLLQNGIYYALLGSLVAAIYTALRAAKEGADVDEIAQVFA